MAKMPIAAVKAPPMPADDDAAASADDAGMGADPSGEDQPGDENVILTVCKEADGSYCLYKGDEEDADGADTAGSADASGDTSGKQTFDSKGALLKGILDLLNADEDSDGGEGAAGGDQFQAGFDEGAPSQTAAPMPQKY